MKHRSLLLLVFLWLQAIPALKASPTVPAGGTTLYTGTPPAAFTVRGGDVTSYAFSTVDVSGQTFTKAWKLETLKDLSTQWSIELNAKVNLAVVKNGVGLLHFWARATTITDPLAIGHLLLIVQKAGGNYDKSLFKEINLSGQWSEFFVPFQMSAAYAANGCEITLDAGYRKQAVEIGGFEAIYYGTSLTLADLPVTSLTYPGEEAGSAWRTEALARIETLRKGNFKIHVVDDTGAPLKDASVHVAMTKHAFPFGTPISFQFLTNDTPANRTYQHKFNELFNAGSSGNDLKWPPWMGDWGPSMTHTQALYGIKWMHDRGIRLRGHVLVWPGWSELPNFINGLKGTANQNTIPTKVLEHIKEMTDFTRGYTSEWDVINEPYVNHALMDLFGQSIMLDWFDAAHTALPDNELYMNDWNNHDDQADPAHVQVDEDVMKYLLANGAPVTGMGVQAHIGGNPNAPLNVLNTFDRFGALGIKLRITEFDVNTTDTTLQADYTRDFLIAAFSHPAVNGFQFWGFWETDHWIPDAALYKADFTEKPNALAYKALVLDQWWTRFDATTDANGDISGRGFFGDYTVTATLAGQRCEKTFSIHADEAEPTVTLTSIPPRLINLSTRSYVGSTEGPAIVGLVIQGTEPKQVVIRAVGPTLGEFHVANFLPHPVLTLYDSANAPVATNTGWTTLPDTAAAAKAFQDAGAFAFTPGSADSALVVTLAPGTYTAIASALPGEKGVTLVEAYELGAGPSHLVNLSNRSFVGTGDNVAISGLTVSGSNARTFLVRGIGPGLQQFKVTGFLARPLISIYKAQTPFAGNAIWSTNGHPEKVAAAITNSGAFAIAADSTDAAMLVTLEPGAYTVITSGSDGGTGNCLVEIYEVNSE